MGRNWRPPGRHKCHYPGMTIYVNDTKKPDVFIACPRKDCVFHCSGYAPGQRDGPRLFVRLEIPINGDWHMPEDMCEIITEWKPEIRNYVFDSCTSIEQSTAAMIYGIQINDWRSRYWRCMICRLAIVVHKLNKVHSKIRVVLFHLGQSWKHNLHKALCPSDSIRRRRSESTLVPIIAWCLMSPRHYQNQY